MKLSDFASNIVLTLKSTVKICLQSRPIDIKASPGAGRLIIMANGPSLNTTIGDSMAILEANDTMSVNFAPLAPVYSVLRPRYHILADPLFFCDDKPHNVIALYDALAQVSWALTLIVPVTAVNHIPARVTDNPNITLRRFNFVGAEGFQWFENAVYSHRLAMPRPRNILIPAIMCGIWLGYKEIYLTGADHSWMQTISVDENNNVISVQPHFYKDDKREQQRVDTTYRNYRLHDIVHSFYVAFRSYHTLAAFARHCHVDIFNSTPGSFIDAFPRRPLA